MIRTIAYIPLEVIAFLDPTIEKLCFEQSEGKTSIHLKFRDEDEIILNNAVDLEQYLSSGTIKGIITFSMDVSKFYHGDQYLGEELKTIDGRLCYKKTGWPIDEYE